MNRLSGTIMLAGLLLAGMSASRPAVAHPHVFAEARLDVVVKDGKFAALRHLWRFDELFTTTVLVEFDLNSDLKLDDGELAEVGNIVRQSLADFDYFQFVTADGKDVTMKAPDTIIADMQDEQLILLFESAPTEPLDLPGKLAIGVYDPTFYTAIDFAEDDNLAVEGLPAKCVRAVVRPDPEEAIAENQQNLTQAFYDTTDPTDLSKIFATRLELSCK